MTDKELEEIGFTKVHAWQANDIPDSEVMHLGHSNGNVINGYFVDDIDRLKAGVEGARKIITMYNNFQLSTNPGRSDYQRILKGQEIAVQNLKQFIGEK